MTDGPSYLLCRIDDLISAIPIPQVIEIMRVLPCVPLADTPPWLLGVSVIRGVPTPVVDLARAIRGESASRPSRVVTVRAGERQAALAVGEIVGIAALRNDSMPLLRDAARGVVDAVATLDRDLLLVLDSARVVPEDVWAAMQDSHA